MVSREGHQEDGGQANEGEAEVRDDVDALNSYGELAKFSMAEAILCPKRAEQSSIRAELDPTSQIWAQQVLN